MRVRFKSDWDHVTPEKTTAYKAGTEVTIAADVAELAGARVEEVPLLKDQEPAKPAAKKRDGD